MFVLWRAVWNKFTKRIPLYAMRMCDISQMNINEFGLSKLFFCFSCYRFCFPLSYTLDLRWFSATVWYYYCFIYSYSYIYLHKLTTEFDIFIFFQYGGGRCFVVVIQQQSHVKDEKKKQRVIWQLNVFTYAHTSVWKFFLWTTFSSFKQCFLWYYYYACIAIYFRYYHEIEAYIIW